MSTNFVSTNRVSLLGRLKSLAISLNPKEASFERQGFPGIHSPSVKHLETVLRAFVDGFNLALVEPDTRALVRRLTDSIAPEYVGFAFEGTGLYFSIMDLMIPGSARLEEFTHSAGQGHDYIAMVGAGFAIARIPFALGRLEPYQNRLDEVLAFCLADGYGFHEGFFKWRSFVDGRKPSPASLNPQNRQLFDSGIARAMWWVYGADPVAIADAISRFDEPRRAEMWAGLGIALTYASAGPGVTNPTAKLLELSGPYRNDLLSAIPFSAHMRWKGRNPAPWTEQACAEMLNMSIQEASDLAMSVLHNFIETSQSSSQEYRRHSGYLVVRERMKEALMERLAVRSRATSGQ